jgi:hypothetical protein
MRHGNCSFDRVAGHCGTNVMTPNAGIAPFGATSAEPMAFARAETVQSQTVRPKAVQGPLHGDVYLFIYRIRHSYDAYTWVDNIRYCTVFALGRSFADAERIAINSVHQHGWRILKTDTATPFSPAQFSDGGTDAAHVANLSEFGVSFKLNR